MELRLRCGLLPEALQLARAHAAAQPDAGARTATLSSLIGAIAAWAVGAQAGEARERGGATVEGGGGHCWARTALLELCFSEEVRWGPVWVCVELLCGRRGGEGEGDSGSIAILIPVLSWSKVPYSKMAVVTMGACS